MSNNDLLFFNSDIEIYWHSAALALAIVAGYFLFFIFARSISKKAVKPVLTISLVSFPLSLILSRAQYCFFRQGEFSGFMDILRLTDGGFGLYGAMLGVATAIFAVRLFDKTMSVAELFDCACIGGAPAICIGRLACFFSHEEKGFALTKLSLARLMFTTYNEAENVYTVDVYMYEAIAAALIFAVLIIDFILVYGAKKFKKGTVIQRFLLLYSIIQTLLESWRSDSLFLNSLGFVRFSQALSAVIFAVLLVCICVRNVRLRGFGFKQVIIWVGFAAMIAGAFVCEFTLTGNTRLRNYGIMAACLLGVLILGCVLFNRTQRFADGEWK